LILRKGEKHMSLESTDEISDGPGQLGQPDQHWTETQILEKRVLAGETVSPEAFAEAKSFDEAAARIAELQQQRADKIETEEAAAARLSAQKQLIADVAEFTEQNDAEISAFEDAFCEALTNLRATTLARSKKIDEFQRRHSIISGSPAPSFYDGVELGSVSLKPIGAGETSWKDYFERLIRRASHAAGQAEDRARASTGG
jgi:hypothetical protein